MPVLDFQRVRETVLPEWTKPENTSVFDPFYRAPIRTIIKALGLDDPQQVMAFGTPLETGPMAGGAVEALSKRFPRFAEALKVYHGSPHDFEKFDASKIGTGEGAQAYGHGLYFAESPDVARTYQGKVSAMQGGTPTIGGRPINWDDPAETAAFEAWRHGGDRGKAAAFHEQTFAKDSVVPSLLRSDAPLPKIDPPGKTYEVAIHADPEHFLDWDKPLSQQSDHVRNALSRYAGPNKARDGMELAGGGVLRITEDPDFGPRYFMEIGGKKFKLQARDIQNLIGQGSEGKSVYQRIMDEEGSQVAASEKLRRLGITGLRYFDQASRTGGEGTRNYVVFPGNEHLIDILKKYGIAATTGVGVAGGLASQERQ